MRYVTVDLEATCWQSQPQYQRANSEVIEVGAVAHTDVSRGTIIMDFFDHEKIYLKQLYIKPIKHPVLTDYCINLTGITQETIDHASYACEVYPQFIEWLTPHFLGSTMVSWGKYDWNMLKKEIEQQGLRFPFNNHINLKEAFSEYEGRRPKGLKKAINSLGWTFKGKQHSGMDDAFNTHLILKLLIKEKPHVLKPRLL